MTGEFSNEGGGYEIDPPQHAKLRDLERVAILERLEFFGGRRNKTALSLGIGLRTLGMKLRQYRKEPQDRRFSGFPENRKFSQK